jgi:predicted RNase H-like nuclease (RuvC/YqgF family)
MKESNMNHVEQATADAASLKTALASARDELAAAEKREKDEELCTRAELGDAESKRELTALEKEIAALKKTIATRERAVAGAERRIGAAREAERLARERANAAAAAPVLARFESHGAKIDQGLCQALESALALRADLRELERLGAPVPSGRQLEVLSRDALDAALCDNSETRPVPFHAQIPAVAPDKRHTFAALTAGWARMSANWAARVLADQLADREKAA